MGAGETIVWSNKAGMTAVPASIWSTSSKEVLESAKIELQVTHKIRIRYRSGITSKDRIIFGSRIFKIVSLINFEERNKTLDMLCIEDI